MTKNTPKLIRLDHALQAISEQYRSDMPEHDLKMLIAARKRLKALPTEESQPTARAYWMARVFDPASLPRYECSHCGDYVDAGDDRNFCPSCGARMDLEYP